VCVRGNRSLRRERLPGLWSDHAVAHRSSKDTANVVEAVLTVPEQVNRSWF
jgi:hypothetical protein